MVKRPKLLGGGAPTSVEIDSKSMDNYQKTKNALRNATGADSKPLGGVGVGGEVAIIPTKESVQFHNRVENSDPGGHVTIVDVSSPGAVIHLNHGSTNSK